MMDMKERERDSGFGYICVRFQYFPALVALLALGGAYALPDHPGYGYAPKFYCRDTNTSIYAEVCVPGIDTATKPVELDIKRVKDDEYCYTQTSTHCEVQTKKIEREVCTYSYTSKRERRPATTVQITDDVRSETMKVTACTPTEPAYGYGYGGKGHHEYCREEYQTQEYRLPKVDEPLETEVDTAVPVPVQECRTIQTELTEVVCNDVTKDVCVTVAAYEEAKTTSERTEAILGEPDCAHVTLTLPTEACTKHHAGYHK